MSQRDDLLKVLHASGRAMTKEELAMAITGKAKTAGNYSAALSKLVEEKLVVREKKGRSYFFILSEKSASIPNEVKHALQKKGNKSTPEGWKTKELDEDSIDLLVQKLSCHKEKLSSLYMKQRGIKFDLADLKNKLGLELAAHNDDGKATFENHLELKEHLWEHVTKHKDLKLIDVLDWIVIDWGGIGKNRKIKPDNSIFSEILKREDNDLIADLTSSGRVASWSKIISFMNPREFYVYDARVAFTLNYLLASYSFPVPFGNTFINAHCSRTFQPTKEDYLNYCKTIRRIHAKLWPDDQKQVQAYKTEMLLFALLNDKKFRDSIPEGIIM